MRVRVICVDSAPSFYTPGEQLIEGKSYYVEGIIIPTEPRYLLRGMRYSHRADKFIPAEVEFEIEKQIFEALK